MMIAGTRIHSRYAHSTNGITFFKFLHSGYLQLLYLNTLLIMLSLFFVNNCLIYADDKNISADDKVRFLEKTKLPEGKKCDFRKNYCNINSSINGKYSFACKEKYVKDSFGPVRACAVLDANGNVLNKLEASDGFVNDDGSYITILGGCGDICSFYGLEFHDSNKKIIKTLKYTDIGFLEPEILHDSLHEIIVLYGYPQGSNHREIITFDSKGNRLWSFFPDYNGILEYTSDFNYLYFRAGQALYYQSNDFDKTKYGIQLFNSINGRQVGNILCNSVCELLDYEIKSNLALILINYSEIKLLNISYFMKPSELWSFNIFERQVELTLHSNSTYPEGSFARGVLGGKIMQNGKYLVFDINDIYNNEYLAITDSKSNFIYTDKLGKVILHKDKMTNSILKIFNNKIIEVHFGDEKFSYEINAEIN